MKLLLLGPHRPKLISYLSMCGDEVFSMEKPFNSQSECIRNVDFIISYGYRYILKEDVINLFPRRIINLHISLLPWNRGADPNLWSFLEDTPKGVTIHYIDAGIDTGEILAQEEVAYMPDDTLRSSYERLCAKLESLFEEVWPKIRAGSIKATLQPEGGSFHALKDRSLFEHLLLKGWDTPVAELIGKAKK